MKQKVSIVASNSSGVHQNALLKAAKNYGFDAEIVLLDKGANLKSSSKTLGDAVLWRSSGLDQKSERASLLPYVESKFLVSEAIFINPFVASKYYQQSRLSCDPILRKYSIPTLKNQTYQTISELMKKKKIEFPIICKPDKGDKGVGVVLVKNDEDLRVFFEQKKSNQEYVYQPYIKNNGDYRVIVVGGVPLGALRREAKPGTYLNNISQGADSYAETDEQKLALIYDIAVKTASVFRLRFTGVDIIFDESNQVYKVLEVNTAPQWLNKKGFQDTVGVDVPEKLMCYIDSMLNRDQRPFNQSVQEYYTANINYSQVASFHFYSRMWLWTGEKEFKKQLYGLQGWFIGLNDKQIREKISNIIDSGGQNLTVNDTKKFRENYFKKYPNLRTYNALMFKVLFCDSIYDLDVRPYVKERVSDADLIKLFTELINDYDAQRVLSTHAVNYFYLIKNYFKASLTLSSRVLVNPHELIHTASDYSSLITAGEMASEEAIKQKIHLLTHAILGESKFYQEQITNPGYIDIFVELERTIRENYSTVSLDNKFEFLVCAQLVGQKTDLEPIIFSEATLSKSWAGNFIVDTANYYAKPTGHELRSSEHRNVLYLMACEKFKNSEQSSTKKVEKNKNGLPVIGRLARLRIEELGGIRLLARIDTGATTSSIHCSSARETAQGLEVEFGSDIFGPSELSSYVFTTYKKTAVKRQGIGKNERFTIPLTVTHGNKSITIQFTLASREGMLYPVLLGRNYLRGNYIVDTSKQFVT